MTQNENDSINILLISSSKLLKNKFIESISNDLNNFSLMSKTTDSIQSASERFNFSCFVSDYTTELTDSCLNTNYVQLIEANEKNLLNTLIFKTASKQGSDKTFNFNINGIIYLYDESSSDTFAYIQSVHNELKKIFQVLYKAII